MAKHKKVTMENLDEAINEILKEYEGEITKHNNEVTMKVGKLGVQLLKEESKKNFSGKKYYKSWAAKYDKNERAGYTATLYSKLPGLPHLLEYSHQVGRNGHYEGRPHIQPVEERIVDEYQKLIVKGV